jgi:hypothetical protein
METVVSKRDRAARREAARLAELKRQRERRRRKIFVAGAAVSAVVLTIMTMVVVKVSGGGSKSAAASTAVPAGVMANLTGIPAATFDQVGLGDVNGLPKRIDGQPALTKNAKPFVLYVGAEYCPFCAAQRWPLVVALMRFGTFTGLQKSSSAADDAYPSTPTLSFHGSTYRSDFLTFEGLETQTNVRVGSNYGPLEQPTAEQAAIMRKYNATPFVDKQSAGAIPFIDFGNMFVLSGSMYSPDMLAGKSVDDIAAELSDPRNKLAQAIDGSANALTAVLCTLTGSKPATVCDSAAVKAFDGKL